MKKKIIRFLKVVSIMLILSFILSTYIQAVSIQIVPSTSRITNVTVSTSFQTCRDLDSLESTLGTTALDPHLSTNKDWGAVSFLANSIYGVNAQYDLTRITSYNENGKVGKKISIDNKTFYSTTANITGVMNWGLVQSQTASLISSVYNAKDADVAKSLCGSAVFNNIKVIYSNRNSKYVENLTGVVASIVWVGNGLDWMGYRGNASGSEANYPVCGRYGLFAFFCGDPAGQYFGASSSGGVGGATFRPVIWNIE